MSNKSAVKKSLEESQRAQSNVDAFKRLASAGHDDFVETLRKCDRFYTGDQWNKEDKVALGDRPALTINMFMPTINAMVGEMMGKRVSVKHAPRSANATPETAKILDRLSMQIAQNNDLKWKQGEVMSDGLIGGRGFFDVRMDWSENVQGEIRITTRDPAEVLIDRQAQSYDPRGWREVIWAPWLSIDQVGTTYGPEAAQRVKARGFAAQNLPGDLYETEKTRFGQEMTEEPTDADSEEFTSIVRSVRVIDRQFRRFESQVVFVDPKSGETRPVAPGWDEARRNEFAQRYGLEITRKTVERIRWVVTAGDVVLHDDWSPYRDFTIVPYFAYWRRGRPFGLGENLISPQEQLNKTSSQELHIINTTANSGWIIPAGSLVNMTADTLEKSGAKTGLVLEYNVLNGLKPEKIQPNQIPTGIAQAAQNSQGHFQSISGVAPSMVGQDQGRVSGVAIEQQQRGTLVQMEVPMDHFRMTMTMLARSVLGMVQTYYTGERLIRYMDPTSREAPEGVMTINQVDALGEIGNNVTLGEYDIAVNFQPARETFEDTQFAEVLELRNAGFAIPDWYGVRFSHLDDREAIAEEMKSMAGLREPTALEQQMAQLQMQMQVAREQAEIAKLQAQATELEAKAQLAMAQAGESQSRPQMQAMQAVQDIRKTIAKLSADAEARREELETKLEIARIHANTKASTSAFEATSARVSEELKARLNARVALQRNLNTNTPTRGK